MSLRPTFIVVLKNGLSEEETNKVIADIRKIPTVKSVSAFNRAADGKDKNLSVIYEGNSITTFARIQLTKGVSYAMPV